MMMSPAPLNVRWVHLTWVSSLFIVQRHPLKGVIKSMFRRCCALGNSPFLLEWPWEVVQGVLSLEVLLLALFLYFERGCESITWHRSVLSLEGGIWWKGNGIKLQDFWHPFPFLSFLRCPIELDPFLAEPRGHRKFILFGRKAVRSSFRNGVWGRLLGHLGIVPLTASPPHIWGSLWTVVFLVVCLTLKRILPLLWEPK